jgi:phosphoadenosine phosphosulfate reductase
MFPLALKAPTINPELAAKARNSVQLLRDAVRDHGKVVYSSSLGPEAIVLTDLIWTEAPEIDILTLDTGRLPQETLELLERQERHYGKRVRVVFPDAVAVEKYVAAHGINGFYNSIEERQYCCHVRKVLPFRRAIQGYAAWVTGVRREQSVNRAQSSAIDKDQYGLAKLSPLLEWTETEVWTWIVAKGLPYNVLHDRNYASIGCAPCTRAIEPGQDQRAGRWWWESDETRECGLHPSDNATPVGQLSPASALNHTS